MSVLIEIPTSNHSLTTYKDMEEGILYQLHYRTFMTRYMKVGPRLLWFEGNRIGTYDEKYYDCTSGQFVPAPIGTKITIRT